MDLVGRKILLQLANELPKAPSAFSYRGRERTIELAVKKELPVLGIEAHDIGRQHIDGEIRRELRNVFAVMLREAVPAIACHEVSTRVSFLIASSADRRCEARIPRVPDGASFSSRAPRHRLTTNLAVTRELTGAYTCAALENKTWLA